MKVRIPTDEEWAAFDAMHCETAVAKRKHPNWRCPGCSRTLRECVRWQRIGGTRWRKVHSGSAGGFFTLRLCIHHDHGDRWKGTVLVCGVCNAADGAVKRVLELPANWSFTAAEIAQFVTVPPHSGAVIDYDEAHRIYEKAKP